MHALTATILGDSSLKSRFCRIDVHEEEGQPDRLWLEYTPDDVWSEGEYIAVDQSEGGCTIFHDEAFNVGGHATLWDFWGTEAEALRALVDYLQG